MFALSILLLPLLLNAQSYYLDIPEIKGESERVGYEEQIEINSFSWNTSTTPAEPGSGARDLTRPSWCAMRLGKVTDRASPYLLKGVTDGDPFPLMKLTQLVNSGPGGEQQVVMEYELRDVLITLFDTGGSEGDFRANEVIALHPTRVTLTVYEYDEIGGPRTHVHSYDFATGTTF